MIKMLRKTKIIAGITVSLLYLVWAELTVFYLAPLDSRIFTVILMIFYGAIALFLMIKGIKFLVFRFLLIVLFSLSLILYYSVKPEENGETYQLPWSQKPQIVKVDEHHFMIKNLRDFDYIAENDYKPNCPINNYNYIYMYL